MPRNPRNRRKTPDYKRERRQADTNLRTTRAVLKEFKHLGQAYIDAVERLDELLDPRNDYVYVQEPDGEWTMTYRDTAELYFGYPKQVKWTYNVYVRFDNKAEVQLIKGFGDKWDAYEFIDDLYYREYNETPMYPHGHFFVAKEKEEE